MSIFTTMVFCGGSDGDEFVAHANKFTKEQAINAFMQEYSMNYDGQWNCPQWRKPTEDDITEAYVRYFIRPPDYCGYESDGGCYSFCSKCNRGCFPVYVITLKALEVEK